MHLSASIFFAPYLHLFSKGAIWYEFSEQYQHQSIKKSKNDKLAVLLCKKGEDIIHILVGHLC